MSAAQWIAGDKLRPDVQRQALARFVHRYTGEHVPKWARARTKPHFATDAEWLAGTRFAIRGDGQLSERVRHCESSPTFPSPRPGVRQVTRAPRAEDKPAPFVTLRMPADSWATLRETLEVDSHSSAFDSSLRAEISDALETVEEVNP